MKKDLYQIGEIAEICNISVQALRHYDRIGLLSPAFTDDDSGYRFYSHKQILTIKIIQEFKKLNFSLKEIQNFVDRKNLHKTLGLILKKEEETADNLRRISDNLEHIKKLKNSLKYFFSSEFDENINHVFIEERKVLFKRYKSKFIPDTFITRFTELYSIAEKFGFKPRGYYMAIFHDHYTVFNPENADIEVCVEVENPANDMQYIRTLDKGEYVTKIHIGPYSKIPESYGNMLEWMDENNLEMSGSTIESYIIDFFLTENQEEFVTKLHIPAKPKNKNP